MRAPCVWLKPLEEVKCFLNDGRAKRTERKGQRTVLIDLKDDHRGGDETRCDKSEHVQPQANLRPALVVFDGLKLLAHFSVNFLQLSGREMRVLAGCGLVGHFSLRDFRNR